MELYACQMLTMSSMKGVPLRGEVGILHVLPESRVMFSC